LEKLAKQLKHEERTVLIEHISESSSSFVNRITNYVTNRQNEDGGYTFCQFAESNAQDTYYGLAILDSLNSSFPNVEKTVSWLNELRTENIFSTYNVTNALSLCKAKISTVLRKRITSQVSSLECFDPIEGVSELSSEFTTTYMALELANLLNLETKNEALAKWILQSRNKDNGFGSQNHSNINSTYYALASLNLLKILIHDLHETTAFVRKCEKPQGGFTVIPIGTMPYMEHTYYGALSLELLGEKSRYPEKTINFVLECQNRNGGFARSDLGISTFENTYYAISIMKKLNFL